MVSQNGFVRWMETTRMETKTPPLGFERAGGEYRATTPGPCVRSFAVAADVAAPIVDAGDAVSSIADAFGIMERVRCRR